jgi:uroporphyrinogen-III synthase
VPDTTAPTLLVTRPAAASRRFLGQLRASLPGIRSLTSPLVAIHPVAADLTGPRPDAVILTSEQGARAAAGAGLPRGLVAYCVGAQTARAAAQAGFAAEQAGPDADSLAAHLLGRLAPGQVLWHLRGAEVRGEVAARLRAAGHRVNDPVVYRQDAQPLTRAALRLLSGRGPVVAPVFSPRTGAILAAQGPFAAPLHLVAFSPAVAEALAPLARASLVISERPDAAAMVSATVRAVAGANPP